MKTIKCQGTAQTRTQEGTEGIYTSPPNLMAVALGGQEGEQGQPMGVFKDRVRQGPRSPKTSRNQPRVEGGRALPAYTPET